MCKFFQDRYKNIPENISLLGLSLGGIGIGAGLTTLILGPLVHEATRLTTGVSALALLFIGVSIFEGGKCYYSTPTETAETKHLTPQAHA